jgi:outer membrane protein TolC
MVLMQERFKLGQSTIIDLKEAQRTFEETNYRMKLARVDKNTGKILKIMD